MADKTVVRKPLQRGARKGSRKSLPSARFKLAAALASDPRFLQEQPNDWEPKKRLTEADRYYLLIAAVKLADADGRFWHKRETWATEAGNLSSEGGPKAVQRAAAKAQALGLLKRIPWARPPNGGPTGNLQTSNTYEFDSALSGSRRDEEARRAVELAVVIEGLVDRKTSSIARAVEQLARVGATDESVRATVAELRRRRPDLTVTGRSILDAWKPLEPVQVDTGVQACDARLDTDVQAACPLEATRLDTDVQAACMDTTVQANTPGQGRPAKNGSSEQKSERKRANELSPATADAAAGTHDTCSNCGTTPEAFASHNGHAVCVPCWHELASPARAESAPDSPGERQT